MISKAGEDRITKQNVLGVNQQLKIRLWWTVLKETTRNCV